MDDQRGANRRGGEQSTGGDKTASKGINPVQHSERSAPPNPVQHSERGSADDQTPDRDDQQSGGGKQT